MPPKKFLVLVFLLGFCIPARAQIVEGNEALSFMDPVNLQVVPELSLPLQPPLPLKLNGKSVDTLPPAPQVPVHTVTLMPPSTAPRKRRRRSKGNPTSNSQLKAPFAGKPTLAQRFGLHRKAGKFTFSRGIDFTGPLGSNVRSTDSGLVLYAGTFADLGNVVVIGHGPNRRSRYLFLSEVAVKAGDRVNQGTLLGKGGSTQMHFEYWLKISGTAWRAQDAAALFKL